MLVPVLLKLRLQCLHAVLLKQQAGDLHAGCQQFIATVDALPGEQCIIRAAGRQIGITQVIARSIVAGCKLKRVLQVNDGVLRLL